jgi:glycosyltransferase involved in cell wall biosynthesis
MVLKLSQENEYPVIAPLPPGISRPLWSVMIPTYNSTKYLVQTLESILAQDPGAEHMQIEVVDNCSTQDDPATVVREIGKGRVLFFRQNENVGLTENFNTCIQRSTGHYVHILHSDDWVASDFYSSFQKFDQVLSDTSLLVCPSTYVDENGSYLYTEAPITTTSGQAKTFTELQATRNRIQAPGVIVARWVYETIGGFNTHLSHCIDWEMWFRASLLGETIALTNSKSFYRIHSESDSSKLVLTGKNITEAMETVDILFEMLPANKHAELLPVKYSWITEYAILNSRNFYSCCQWDTSLIHAMLAWKISPRLFTLKNLLKVFFTKQSHRFVEFLLSRINIISY